MEGKSPRVNSSPDLDTITSFHSHEQEPTCKGLLTSEARQKHGWKAVLKGQKEDVIWLLSTREPEATV